MLPGLVGLLKENRRIVQLGLGCNSLGEAGAAALLKGLGLVEPTSDELAHI